MPNTAADILNALASRGSQVALRMPGYEIGADEVLEWVNEVRRQLAALPFELAPGSVLGIRGVSPRARIAAPLAAWSLGYSTYLMNAREPDTRVPELVAEAGCRAWIESCEDEVLQWVEAAGALVLSEGPHTLLRTSGSTGTPKIAVHGLAQHWESARAAAQYFGLGQDDTWLLTLPSWHVGGLGILFRALHAGAALAIPAFDAPLEHSLEAFAPSHVSLVSTQLFRMLRIPAQFERLRACRGILIGGGPLPPTLRALVLAERLPVHISYGSTETSALIAISGDTEVVGTPNAAGFLLPGRRARIDAAGQLQVAGPTIFRGYLASGLLLDARDEDGWFPTGDRGSIDESGLLRIHGRMDRMFISGGENIQPEEIEAALLDLEDVEEAVVVPRPSTEFGERPVAFLKLRAGASSTDVEAALRTHLPGYKVPDVFLPLPKPGPGRLKIDRAYLERVAREGYDA